MVLNKNKKKLIFCEKNAINLLQCNFFYVCILR